jgi:hypothetical protein
MPDLRGRYHMTIIEAYFFVFLIPYLFGLFLLNSQEVKDIHSLLSGLWFYSISVFPLLVEKNTSVTDKKKEDQSLQEH